MNFECIERSLQFPTVLPVSLEPHVDAIAMHNPSSPSTSPLSLAYPTPRDQPILSSPPSYELNISLTASPLLFLPASATTLAVSFATPAIELSVADTVALSPESSPKKYHVTRRAINITCSGRYRAAAIVRSVRVRKRMESKANVSMAGSPGRKRQHRTY